MIPDSDGRFEALSLLSLCEPFSHIDPENLAPSELDPLRSEVAIVNVQRGDVLLRQGDPADCMYAVVRGRLQVFVIAPDGEQHLVGELRSGETVGELGLIDGSPRMATVVAVRDSQLVRVSPIAFDRLVRFKPESMSRIARAEAERMRNMGSRRAPVTAVRTFTIVGAGAQVERFTESLCAALQEIGSILRLSRLRFEQLYHTNFEAGDGIVGWLVEVENAYDFVIYEVEPGLTPWTLHSLRQADRIVAVNDSSGSSGLSETEQFVLEENKAGRTAGMELVLLHERDESVFPGTSRWLGPRVVLRHHHVRLNVPADVSRVARLLAGRSIGLTLGGGGARGYAHIGVLRALEEAGVPIDVICGVSMGSIISALYAMGHHWRSMIELMKRDLARNWNSDFTLPIVALSSGRRFQKALRALYGDTAIEDLGITYFCTSCNLSNSEMVTHRRGSLLNAVHASNAIPVVFPPVISSGQMLVDGGVLNNTPGDVLKELCGGLVIVSNVSPRSDVTVDSSFAEMPSAWHILRSRLNPFEPTIRVPGIAVTMMRTLMVASERKSREVENMADYYLRVPIDRFRSDDFKRVEEIAEVGYEYARQEIRLWKQNGLARRPSPVEQSKGSQERDDG
jgi:predicted acylesterase/phospholipase RssA/CRP-like cAMP-binding protein